jgi:16S rRNA (guanine1207-N2)-methyltransferase
MSEPLPGYYRTHELLVHLGGQAVRAISKPGLPGWDRLLPATVLLAEAVSLPPDANVLLINSRYGALAVFLARLVAHGAVCVLESNTVSRAMSELTLRANGIANAAISDGISVLPARQNAFDAAVMDLPKGRKLARRYLLEAYQALRAGGHLYLAGANDEGIRSVAGDAESLFGNATTVAYGKRNRVARAVKRGRSGMPGWAEEPGIAPGTWFEFRADVRETTFRLRSLPGVFSYDRLDEGSALLLSVLQVPEGSRVLDVGCGYGILGLAASRWGASCVDMIDVDLLAVASAQESAILTGVGNASAFPSDVLSAVRESEYDLVVSNPPFHIGKAVDYEVAQAFIEDSWRVLRPGGRLTIVANRFLRYDKAMRSAFRHLDCIAETGRYWVLSAER